MATQEKELNVQEMEKQEVASVNGAERTRARKAYVPKVDIYETDEAVITIADMPGVDENSLEITLDKNVLTIDGFVEPEWSEKYDLVYAEYEVGDFHRRFTLSNEIDRDKIEARVKDGVLRLYLPKIGPAQARKISVTSA
jgi:HSP20 family molecular chaperone IbpA